MAYQVVKMRPILFADASPTVRFPKIIMQDRVITYIIPSALVMLSGVPEWVLPDTITLEPEEDTEIVLGVDYETLLVELPTGGATIVSAKIDAPSLVYQGGLSFEWGSSYQTPTRVYRSEFLKAAPEDAPFHLIAEVDPVTTPGGSASFTDHSSLDFVNYTYEYFVSNRNGKSNTIRLVSP